MNVRGFDALQKIAMTLMAVLAVLTFVGSNLHALLWQQSSWLVGTVLPAVVVDLTNEERAMNHAAPLQRNAVLDEAARLKAEHMAKYEYFAHFSPDGVSPWHWFDKAGYRYAFAGENLAIHFTDSDEVVEAWMNSPAHRQNIVDQKYTEIGVGTAKGEYEGYKTVYVVQLFGAPAAVVTEKEGQVVATLPDVAAVEVEGKEVLGSHVIQAEVEVARESVAVTAPQVATEIAPTPPPAPEKTSPTPPLQTAQNVPDSPAPAVTKTVTMANDVVVVEMPVISTSSGLAVAQITRGTGSLHAGATVSAVLTKPNELLQFVYTVVGSVVVLLLSLSIVLEARRLRLAQVAYGIMLLCGMGTLWYVHALLTSGAVVA
ncbi:MAG: hypothetical protein H6780_04035 [Candidatus Nomurabacteria bacterium]|nr:MAG: hypothetical protein H6780_04035 [Candidatus Nomurabacteria bacterium]